MLALCLGLVFGATLSGLVIGAFAGLLRVVTAPMQVPVVVLIAAIFVVLEILGFGDRLPQNRRLVSQQVATNGRIEGVFQFGFEMGTGIRTYVTSSAPYLVVIAVLLLGELSAGVIAGFGFGLGRCALVVVRASYSGAGGNWVRAVERLKRTVAMVCSILSAVVVIGLSG